MRYSVFSCLIGPLAFAALSTSSFAQLPTRGELVLQKYDEDRAKGIAALNKRYIFSFEKELDLALSAKELDEANAIQLKIQSLKAEVEALGKPVDAKVSPQQEKEMNPDFLVGKTLGIPFAHDPNKTAYFSFHEDGQAYWLGLRNQKVDRAYEPTGQAREFLLWWPKRGKEYGTSTIKVSPDGKTATVTENPGNKIVNGVIEDSD